jgi:hypothetical protein
VTMPVIVPGPPITLGARTGAEDHIQEEAA